MLKKIIYIYIYIGLFTLLFYYIWIDPEINYSNYNYEDYSLFIPTIIFLILLYLAEKSTSEKTKMKYAIASIILAFISWIIFFIYNNFFL